MTKDGFKTLKEGVEEYLSEKLDCVVTDWFKISFKSLKILRKVVVNYVDLITDCILVGTVLAFIGVAFDNMWLVWIFCLYFSIQLVMVLISWRMINMDGAGPQDVEAVIIVLVFLAMIFGDYPPFATQIIIILLVSILAPLLTSASLIAYQTPLGWFHLRLFYFIIQFIYVSNA